MSACAARHSEVSAADRDGGGAHRRRRPRCPVGEGRQSPAADDTGEAGGRAAARGRIDGRKGRGRSAARIVVDTTSPPESGERREDRRGSDAARFGRGRRVAVTPHLADSPAARQRTRSRPAHLRVGPWGSSRQGAGLVPRRPRPEAPVARGRDVEPRSGRASVDETWVGTVRSARHLPRPARGRPVAIVSRPDQLVGPLDRSSMAIYRDVAQMVRK